MAEINKPDLKAVAKGAKEGENMVPLSTKDYSPSLKIVLNQRLVNIGDVLQVVGQFDPYRISKRQLHLMRKDATLRLALQAIIVPMVNAPWTMQCDDPQVSMFADKALRKIYARLLLQMLTSLEFGYAAIVKRFALSDEPSGWMYEDDQGKEKKVWSSTDVQPVIWNDPRILRPDGARPVFQADGETFNGIQHPLTADSRQGDNEDAPDVPATHSLWVTNERDLSWGDWYGYPRTGYAFRYWWSYWFQYLLKDRHFEQDADPPLLIGVPNEMVVDPDNPTGPPITAQELGMKIGSALRDGATVVLPTEVYENDESGRLSPHARKWTAEFMKGGENLKPMQDSLDSLQQMKLRAALLGPDDALVPSGGKNTTDTLGDLIRSGQAVLMGELDQLLNDHMIPDLLAQNFVDPPECVKTSTGFRDEDMTLVNQILAILAQADPQSLDLDVRKLVKSVGLPQTPPMQSRAGQPTDGGAPPPVQGDQGVQGGAPPVGAPPAAPGQPAGAASGTAATGDGITVTGFDLLGELDEQMDLWLDKADLPRLKQFDDPEIEDLIDDVYNDIAGLLGDFYDAAPKALENA